MYADKTYIFYDASFINDIDSSDREIMIIYREHNIFFSKRFPTWIYDIYLQLLNNVRYK